MSGNDKTNTRADSWLAGLGKHAVGSGILGALGAVGGLIYGLARGKSVRDSAAVGSALGVVSSIGFGKDVYDIATRADVPASATFAERLTAERSRDGGHHR